MDEQRTKWSGGCHSCKRDEVVGFLQLINATSEGCPGNTVNAVECIKSCTAFLILCCTYFRMEAIKNSNLKGQIMQLGVVLLTVHYRLNQSRIRHDSAPLLKSYSRNRTHSIFPLFWTKHILPSSNVRILKIAMSPSRGGLGFSAPCKSSVTPE